MQINDKIYGLRFDTSFKNIFSNENILKQFFKDVFHEDIGKVTYIDKEALKENKYLSYSVFDLLIKTKDEFIIFEMQNQDLKNIEARITMYLSRNYVRQNPGKKYEKVKPVKIRLIINYPYGKVGILKEYHVMEKRLQEQFGIYLDIKIWNIKEALKHRGTIDYKYALLFVLDQFSKKRAQKILRSLKEEKHFQKIIYKIELYNADLKTYERLKNEEERQMKLEDVAEAYKEEGITIGEERGKKIGEKLGESRGIMKTALSMLKKGFEIELISEITGLTKREISKFKEEKNEII